MLAMISSLHNVGALIVSPPATARDAAWRAIPKRFRPLPSPAALGAILDDASVDGISVVKYTAPWCRTCRAAEAKLGFIAKQHPTASFYELTVDKDGPVRDDLKAREITQLPYVEVYVGRDLVEASTLSPSRAAWLRRMIDTARAQRRRARHVADLLELRQNRRRQAALLAELTQLQAQENVLKRRRHLCRLRHVS